MMSCESKRILKVWSRDSILNLKLKGCGLLNCRSRLGASAVSEEIRRILIEKSGKSGNPDQGNSV
ncbi:MAG: hypothetical protein U9N60_02515 [Thermodesulfobacteriota bacterium]|nr:hypothetical protein [Thermodesulfobacteriota bacterium]